MFYEIKIKFNQSPPKLLIHTKTVADILIYISSQGGCKGDMCPGSNSSRLNVASSVCFFYDRGGGGGGETPTPTHGEEKHVGFTAGHCCCCKAATAQRRKLYRAGGDDGWDVMRRYSSATWSIPAVNRLCSPDEVLIHYTIRLSVEINGNKALPITTCFLYFLLGLAVLCSVVLTTGPDVNHCICHAYHSIWMNTQRLQLTNSSNTD